MVLPVCRQAIQLFEKHSNNMVDLAKRLQLDPRTDRLYIKDFKPPRIDVSENKDRLLPMLTKLKTEQESSKTAHRNFPERMN